ncbi:MAG TPA: hypothetical protein VHE61_05185 [Opitutaceae bacterium]|nr:hypothetical protein [Opitutaceae bacterium]
MPDDRRPLLPEWLSRLTAGLSIALVLTLTVLAASPALHAKLHGGTLRPDDHCPVAVFAAGVSVPIAAQVAPPAVAMLAGPRALTAEEIFLSSPRYLRQPERGPPGLE